MEKRNAGRRGYGTCLFASILVGRKYSRRSTLVLHRAIDTSQLKCDVCPLFKLYNVFCSPTRVERCWTAHEHGRRSTEKKVNERYGNSTFFHQLAFPRLRVSVPSHRTYRTCGRQLCGGIILKRRRNNWKGNTDRSFLLGRLTSIHSRYVLRITERGVNNSGTEGSG